MVAWRDGWTDVRVAARTLGRSRGFTAAAILVLALGVGANTALFSAIRATLLVDPPYPEHERLVVLDLTESSTTRPGPPRAFSWSYPKYRMLAELDLPLETTAAYARRTVTLTRAGDATLLVAEFVTPAYTDLLGVRPAAGRFFQPFEDDEGAPLVAVLGHALWEERFGADPDVVGRSVTLDGRAVTVVGVAPAGFRGLTGQASLWVPVRTGAVLKSPFMVDEARAHWLVAIGRAAPGTDAALLDERMGEAGRAIDATWPDTDPTVVRGGAAKPFGEAMVNPRARTSLLVLAAGAVLLLLVACANLAALLLARGAARARETAVRVALGAGRWRVARAFLSESMLLAIAGGVAGLAVARFALDALAGLWPVRYLEASMNIRAAPIDGAGLDPWVLLFATCAALATGVLFGLLPALAAGRADPAARLRGSRATGGSGRGWDARSALVVGEIGMALALVVGAGLMVRSLSALQSVERGFDPEGLVSFSYSIPDANGDDESTAAFHERYLERLAALPGVRSVATACVPPLAGHCVITRVREAGGTTWEEGSRPAIGVHYVSDAFFETLGVPVVRGRTFTSEDQRDAPPVVVLSERAARELFPEGDALGATVSLGVELTPPGGTGAEVVGIVGDVLFDRPVNGVMAEAFLSHRQEAGSGTVLARVAGEPLSVVPGARAALAELDADLVLYNVRTVRDLEARASGDTRVLRTLLAAFAGLALLLACTGVWSVVAFAVARRRREIGVRVALGAEPRRVVRALLDRGVRLGLIGVAVGAVGAAAAGRLLRSFLYGVGPADPLTLIAGALLLVGVATIASWLPARRAARVDPMVVLRSE